MGQGAVKAEPGAVNDRFGPIRAGAVCIEKAKKASPKKKGKKEKKKRTAFYVRPLGKGGFDSVPPLRSRRAPRLRIDKKPSPLRFGEHTGRGPRCRRHLANDFRFRTAADGSERDRKKGGQRRAKKLDKKGLEKERT